MPLKKLFKNIRVLSKKDELCGEWNSDDGSGFMMMMGSWMKIKSNGTGEYESWSNSDIDTEYHHKGEFIWERLGENKICIQKKDAEKVEVITYELKKKHGRIELTSPQPKLEKFGIEAFWDFAQVMFKKE